MTARPALALAPLAALLAVAGAMAAPPPAVRLQVAQPERLPFSIAELRAAVGARLPLAPLGDPATLVTVGPGGPGQIEVASSLRRQQVAVAGFSALESARLVALAVVDVSRDPVTALAPEASPAPIDNLSSGVSSGVDARPGPSRPGAVGGLQAWALVGTSYGVTGSGAAFEPTVGVDHSRATLWRLRGSPLTWGLGLAAGYARGDAVIAAGALDRAFRLETMPLRLGASLGWRWLQASAGPVLRLYRTSGVEGGQGSIGGGFVGLRGILPLGAGFRGLLLVSLDGYTERLEFRAHQLTVVRSQFLIPFIGAGLAWGRS